MLSTKKKSLLFGLVTIVVLLVIAYVINTTSPKINDPITVVKTYYGTDKIFDSAGPDRDQLKRLIAPDVWECIEQGFQDAEQGIAEFGPTEVLLRQCGLRDGGFYQDPYPIADTTFNVVSQTRDVADIEATFREVAQVKLRYLLIKLDTGWQIVRAEKFGYGGAPQYNFPEEIGVIIKSIPSISWQLMPADEYWYPFPEDPNSHVLEGTSMFGRSSTTTFSDSFSEFEPALRKLGWQQDLAVAADGITGSILGYERQLGDRQQYLIFSYETIFLEEHPQDEPPSCPCIYTNKVFFADKPISVR